MADELAVLSDALDEFIASQPAGSRIEQRDGMWYFYRGTNREPGSGKTLARAVQMVGAQHGVDASQKAIIIAENGDILPPE